MEELHNKVIFSKYPEWKPWWNGTNLLVIIKVSETYSFAFRYYSDQDNFETKIEGETIVAFAQADPKKIFESLK